MNTDKCFKKGLLKKIKKDNYLVENTLEMAIDDLNEAELSIKNERYVWAIVQIYTSMLNMARSILFSKGVRERSHYCTVQFLRENFSEQLGDSIEKLDVLRRERHLTLYDSRSHIDEDMVQERYDWAEEFLRKTQGMSG